MSPRRFEVELSRHRVAVSDFNSVPIVIDGIASQDQPAHFETQANWLAQPNNYGEAAFAIETICNPKRRIADRRCPEIILDQRAQVSLKIFRLAAGLGVFGKTLTRGVIPRFTPSEFIAAAPEGKKAEAKIAVSLLGFVDSPDGLIAADDAAGYWPAESSCRLALALNWIVRTRHGARIRWNLRAMP